VAETRARLDQPREERRVTLRPTYDAEAFGRLAERIARFIGTGRFLVYQTVFIVLWLAWNALAPKEVRFDPYPLQFLTLILSLQAAYAAPLILLAQNRQDDRDRVNMEQDRAANSVQLADTEFLARELAAVRIAVGEVVTRDFLRSELRSILEDLDIGEHPGKKDKKKKHHEKVADLPEHPAPGPSAPVEESARPE
jgi:uncharacterized membrane protein